MLKLVDMLVDTGLAKSKNEARTLIKSGAVRFGIQMNDDKFIEGFPITDSDHYIDFENELQTWNHDEPYYQSEKERLDGLYLLVGKLFNNKVSDLRFYHDKENMKSPEEIVEMFTGR